eukprot:9170471-Alexandrium_andersonii.AAC.1
MRKGRVGAEVARGSQRLPQERHPSGRVQQREGRRGVPTPLHLDRPRGSQVRTRSAAQSIEERQ